MQGRQGLRLRERRHRRVPVPGRRVLLPRDEHPAPGRAPRHRAGHRHRPRGRAAAGRGGRAAVVHPGVRSDAAAGPRHRGAHQRREPGRRPVPAVARARSPTLPSRRGSACAGTAATRRATRSASTTTTSSASSSCGAPTADVAIARMLRALGEMRVEGIATTIPADHRHPRATPTSPPPSTRPSGSRSALDLSGIAGAAAPPARRATTPAPKVRRDVDVEVNGKRFAVSVWVPESAAACAGAGERRRAGGPPRRSGAAPTAPAPPAAAASTVPDAGHDREGARRGGRRGRGRPGRRACSRP